MSVQASSVISAAQPAAAAALPACARSPAALPTAARAPQPAGAGAPATVSLSAGASAAAKPFPAQSRAAATPSFPAPARAALSAPSCAAASLASNSSVLLGVSGRARSESWLAARKAWRGATRPRLPRGLLRRENYYGQVGNGLSGAGQGVSRPTLVVNPGGVSSWAEVAAGGSGTTCGLDQGRAAWCWGSGAHGQIGDGFTINRLSPTAVTVPSTMTTWLQLSLGRNAACGLGMPLNATSDMEGLAFCWGGCLQLRSIEGAGAELVRAHVLRARRRAGVAHVCGCQLVGNHSHATPPPLPAGDNSVRQAGVGASYGGAVTVPTAVVLPSGVSLWTQISASRFVACAISAAGGAYCWGDQNSLSSLLGTADTCSPVYAPSPVATAFSWASLSVGSYHVCGVRADTRQAYCW